jgi:thiol-disulfide isomerase/thioredoxin
MKKKRKISNNILLAAVLIIVASSIYFLNSMRASPAGFAPDEIVKGGESIAEGIESLPLDYLEDKEIVSEKALQFKQAPELTAIAGYINTDDSVSILSFKGKVVLVDFWTYTCINCIRTFPYLNSWHEKYEDDGLVIIGVHTPEFNFERDYDNVKQAADRYDLKYAIVQDNDYATWRAYENRFWPRKYLVDIDGFIRYDHIGEGKYGETERVIQELLKERMERLGQKKSIEDMTGPEKVVEVDFVQVGTPEIYLGYDFTRGNFGNKEGLPPNQIIDYEIPLIVNPNKVYLEGTWKINKDDAELMSDRGRIVLGYDAKAVNIVASSELGSEVEVLFDTKSLDQDKLGSDVDIIEGKSTATVKDGRLYNVVDFEYGEGLLELKINGRGFRINTFTFG